MNRCRHDTVYQILRELLLSDGIKKHDIFTKLKLNYQWGNKFLRLLYDNGLIISLGEFNKKHTRYDITPEGALWLNFYTQIEEMM